MRSFCIIVLNWAGDYPDATLLYYVACCLFEIAAIEVRSGFSSSILPRDLTTDSSCIDGRRVPVLHVFTEDVAGPRPHFFGEDVPRVRFNEVRERLDFAGGRIGRGDLGDPLANFLDRRSGVLFPEVEV